MKYKKNKNKLGGSRFLFKYNKRSRFLSKDKKGEMDEFIKVALWILFFILAGGGAYYVIKFLTNVGLR